MRKTTLLPTACVLAVLLTLVSSCRGATGPGLPHELGIIEFFGEREGVLVLPDEVRAGQDFTVTVRTFGAGCTVAAGMGIRYADTRATLTPIDNDSSRLPPGTACPDVLVRPEHVATLRFPAPGAVTLRVIGRAVDGTSAPSGVGRTTIVEAVIQVVP